MSNYRIVFSKKGALSFISHLDFNHSFIRMLKRAGLPLKYSEGFNPRPKIVFGLPLSVGMEGENELVDVALTEDLPCEEVERRLAEAFPADMKIKSVALADVKLKYIELAEYSVTFPSLCPTDGEIAAIEAALANPPPVLKHTKSGEKMTEIAPMLRGYSTEQTAAGFVLNLTLTAFDNMYLKPDYVVDSLNAAGLNLPDDYSVVRTKILFKQ